MPAAEGCLKCKKTKEKCKCDGGFKIIYYMGKPLSEAEAKEIPSLDQAKKNALKAAEEINKFLKKI